MTYGPTDQQLTTDYYSLLGDARIALLSLTLGNAPVRGGCVACYPLAIAYSDSVSHFVRQIHNVFRSRPFKVLTDLPWHALRRLGGGVEESPFLPVRQVCYSQCRRGRPVQASMPPHQHVPLMGRTQVIKGMWLEVHTQDVDDH